MSVDYTPDNTFIFSFVRMNPPTPGHLALIKTMIDKAIDLGIEKAYVITTSSLDGKNPLPCSMSSIPKAKNKSDGVILTNMSQSDLVYKSTILDNMISSYKQELASFETDPTRKEQIENFNVIVICSVGSPFGFINNVIKNDCVNSVNGLVLEREGMEALKNTGIGDRAIADINPSEYSASFVRGLVKNGQKDDFMQVYSKYLSPEEIEKLYQTIQLGIQMKSPSSKDEEENPQSKYFDGGLLPVFNTTGGKRRKTRKNKRKTKKSKRRYSRRK